MPFESCGATADPFGDWQFQDDATVAVLTVLVAIIVGFSAIMVRRWWIRNRAA
jgi:hypothetical protein